MTGATVVTDLIGKLVSVSLWSHDIDSFRHIMNGVVRSVGVQSDFFVLMIQADRERPGNRAPGSLNVFTLGSRGGCEILVLENELGALAEYRSLVARMRDLRSRPTPNVMKDIDILASRMAAVWSSMSSEEQSLVNTELTRATPIP